MHYVIYPDTLFAENLFCNLLFLIFMRNCFFQNVKFWEVFKAAIGTSLSNTILLIVFFRSHWILRTAVLFPTAGLLICSCFQMKDGRRILYILYQMLLWILVLGGVVHLLEEYTALPVGKFLFTVLFFVVFFGTLQKAASVYERQNGRMREVVLYLNGKSYHFQGYADSGNQLVDPIYKKPVSMITSEVWETLIRGEKAPGFHLIPYETVGNHHGMLQGTLIDYMVILNGNDSRIVERPVLAITGESFHGIFQYSILLHSDYC